jgi:hypothetical protein
MTHLQQVARFLQSGSAAPETNCCTQPNFRICIKKMELPSQLAAENVKYFMTLEALQVSAMILWTYVSVKQNVVLPHSEKLFEYQVLRSKAPSGLAFM